MIIFRKINGKIEAVQTDTQKKKSTVKPRLEASGIPYSQLPIADKEKLRASFVEQSLVAE